MSANPASSTTSHTPQSTDFNAKLSNGPTLTKEPERSGNIVSSSEQNGGLPKLPPEAMLQIFTHCDQITLSQVKQTNWGNYHFVNSMTDLQINRFLLSSVAEEIIDEEILKQMRQANLNPKTSKQNLRTIFDKKILKKEFHPESGSWHPVMRIEGIIKLFFFTRCMRGGLLETMEFFLSTKQAPFLSIRQDLLDLPITRRHLIKLGLYTPKESDDVVFLDQPLDPLQIKIITNQIPRLFFQSTDPDTRSFLKIPLDRIADGIVKNYLAGRHDVVQNMLDSKMFFDILEPSDRYNPMLWAISNKNEDLVKKLIKAGFNVNGVYGYKTDAMSALCLAAQANYLPTVNALLESGADVHKRSRFSGKNALDIAINRSSDEIVQVLLDQKRSCREWLTSAMIRLADFANAEERIPGRSTVYLTLLYKAGSELLSPYLAWLLMLPIWFTLPIQLAVIYNLRAVSTVLRFERSNRHW